MSVRYFFFACVFIFIMCIKHTQGAAILEVPTTQYALIGKNATFTCKTIGGREVYWALNGLPLTITYQDKKQEYEDKGVVFMEESIGEYYNLTIIIPASMEFNNTVLLCSVLGADYTSSTSPEVHLIVFNTLRPYSPAVTINISYVEHPTVMATISEIPRWPGYEIVEFKMNITDSEDTLLGRYNTSAENATVEICVPLPDSIINQCVTLKISASAMSEQYGESEATKTNTELFKSPGLFTDQGVKHLILPHTNDSLFHVSLTIMLPDVCKNQPVTYSFVIKNNNSSEVVKKNGPYNHYGPGNVSHCINDLNKNNSYSVAVQVESIAGNRASKWIHLNASNIKSCSAEDTTDLKTSTAVRSPDYQYSTIKQTTEEPMDGSMPGLETALVVILVVLLATLVGVSGVFIWFCNYHHQTLQKKTQSWETCSLEQMVIHLSQEPDTMMMSPAPGGPTSLKEK